MDKKKMVWAALAALFVVRAAVVWFVPKYDTDQNPAALSTPAVVQEEPVPTPKLSANLESAELEPTSSPSSAEQLTLTPKPATEASKKKTGEVFKLKIDGRTISVAYGVDEKTLEKTPGWLTTSVMPGEDGMCVVYGHRNRTHLRVLEKVKIGDPITGTMQDGTICIYTVNDIKIYERTEDFRLPLTDGKALVLATCYPFRYSGNAPGKAVVLATLNP